MNYIIIFFFFLVSGFSGSIAAQEMDSAPSFRGKDTFPNYLRSLLHSDTYLATSQCTRFDSAIKFSIDKNGHIDSLELADNLKGYLALRVRYFVFTTNGQWNPEMLDGEVVTKSKSLILPINFDYQGGCSTRDSPEQIKADKALAFDLKSSSLYEKEAYVLKAVKIFQDFGSEDIADELERQSKN